MDPESALEYQINRYRSMSGEERLLIALRMHEMACEVAREGIRRQHPGIERTEVERLLRERLALVREP